jgi:hypothetical protein
MRKNLFYNYRIWNSPMCRCSILPFLKPSTSSKTRMLGYRFSEFVPQEQEEGKKPNSTNC